MQSTTKRKAVANRTVLRRFRPKICSRHPSHDVLRLAQKNLPALPVRSVIRFGSTTIVEDAVSRGGNRVEINTIEAVQNSSNKLLMKEKFLEAGVRTAPWCRGGFVNIESINAKGFQVNASNTGVEQMIFPIVAKSHFGSKGRGNTLIKNEEEMRAWMTGKTISNYIFEQFMNYGHEFRLHITEDGCFYVCRKALRKDTPESERWHFHDTTCVWLLESNPEFHRPNSYDDIVADCVRALKAVGADILSFDVKVQKPTDSEGRARKYQEYILLECNSASSMDNGTGEVSVCAQKYIEILPTVIMKKAQGGDTRS